MVKIVTMTSIVNSMVILLFLKFFHAFHFIKWHPTAFMKSIVIIRDFGSLEKWFTLGVMIAIATGVLFFATMFVVALPNTVTSIMIATVICVIVYSFIFSFQYEWDKWKTISIPFVALIMISVRFIVETSTFYTKEKLFSHTK